MQNEYLTNQMKQQQAAQVAGELRRHALSKELKRYEHSLKPKQKDQALIEQYKFAQGQGYGGSFIDFKKTVAEAGATRISVGEKLDYKRRAKEIDIKATVRSPNFKKTAIAATKNRYGRDWEELSEYEKDESVFQEMHSMVKAAHPNAVYDPVKDAWVDIKTGKIVRKHSGYSPMFHKRRDKRH
jgi:hypothetical protein